MVVERIAKFLGRRKSKVPGPSASAPQVERTPTRPSVRQAPSRTLIIWESELRAIAAEAGAWTVETGGDLFGRWQGNPTVFLATKAGPNAQRDNAHFRLDVDYLRQLSEPLATDWALRYFGDWHSHHRLGLSAPSSGDRRRIRQLGNRNNFPGMVEIIVTTEGSRKMPVVRVHPWFYDLGVEDEPTAMNVMVHAGCSPVREVLRMRGTFPEQSLDEWQSVMLDRVRIGDATELPIVSKNPGADPTTHERAVSHLAEALERESGAPIEQHTTAFGKILVAQLKEPHHLAFAIDRKWPMNVLEVHRLDRATGGAEQIEVPAGLMVPDIGGIVQVYRAAKTERGIA
ncbi:JAB domain-containing protein similar to deubiquitination enzymes [Mesorhizobium loti]|uniref:JAB domain-containing protein similar to deubiquitination enzymes n=1 Tax=Rhizobium loti TaxID=381 RepID=A0A8E2WA80_RHILI|nr:Mov34/MPN/PAD-1 family protein [Mesorhizobium loti]PWJ89530.1 JAB domain-containing protein similar to deubiquitination enzymes [Mesorhizobium loti]